MNRTRWAALVTAVAVVAGGGVAWGVGAAGSGGGDEQAAEAADESTTSTSERRRTTTTTTDAPTTTTTEPAPTTTTAPPQDDGVLERGDRGPEVVALQQRLTELRFDPGPVDGAFGLGTMYAVQAFQKLHGMAPDGKVGNQVKMALAAPTAPPQLVPNGGPERVEVDLRSQLLYLYEAGELRLITHVSTGSKEEYCVEGDCGNRAITPVGAFRFKWRYDGWRQSRLGKLYNPVYFTSSGVAVHGSTSVPTYPASHGCVRIPMHIAEYFPSLVKSGDPVYVLDGVTPVGPNPQAPSGPPPSDPPTSPEQQPTTTTTTAPPPSTTTTTQPEPDPDPDPDPTTTTTAPPTTLVP